MSQSWNHYSPRRKKKKSTAGQNLAFDVRYSILPLSMRQVWTRRIGGILGSNPHAFVKIHFLIRPALENNEAKIENVSGSNGTINGIFTSVAANLVLGTPRTGFNPFTGRGGRRGERGLRHLWLAFFQVILGARPCRFIKAHDE